MADDTKEYVILSQRSLAKNLSVESLHEILRSLRRTQDDGGKEDD